MEGWTCTIPSNCFHKRILFANYKKQAKHQLPQLMLCPFCIKQIIFDIQKREVRLRPMEHLLCPEPEVWRNE